jgi:hypothetical protein
MPDVLWHRNPREPDHSFAIVGNRRAPLRKSGSWSNRHKALFLLDRAYPAFRISGGYHSIFPRRLSQSLPTREWVDSVGSWADLEGSAKRNWHVRSSHDHRQLYQLHRARKPVGDACDDRSWNRNRRAAQARLISKWRECEPANERQRPAEP